GLADLTSGDAVTAQARVAVETVAAIGTALEIAEPSLVWRAYNEASSGPAADHEPVVSEYADLLAVVGHDDAGERPVVELAERVSLGVERDRDLLTERERTQFEQHVLGELGDAIRRCQVEADELVTAMNQLLGGVTTSQGIRVRLDWRLRDDVPPEARQAVQLLGQPVGALLPEERAVLRDSLHRLIEVSRAERPELAYGEHLATALDYRTWWAFKIRYTRPESAGTWLELHRRSPLSQGEQKVLCYLPLFAAAAAHFSSLAGAAPHAPRLVLLDDAFPKIDVRTHPLLFGLLVQLDLDFVITSERLWGDHDTVPSLAIYEALRDPAQRGIAQYEYRWDGRALRSLG
ncbi:MAG: SbcC/MukB-like Walker B domain-containing protein, partial [Marmoricola sp.]